MHTLEQLRSGALKGIKRLDLSAGLTEFPPEIFELADSLEILNLSDNLLCQLPDDLDRLCHLRILFCSANRFVEFPTVLQKCKSLEMVGFKSNQICHVPEGALPRLLRWLILTDNRLESLPDDLGDCLRLQKLMLAGNRLRALPASLANCTELELLRISANTLEQMPAWISGHPKLAWLAFGGNPFNQEIEREQSRALPMMIPLAELERGHELGQGASGVISSGTWHSPSGSKPVALKKFKGQMTSDGLPELEKAASLAAGLHPHLIPVHGEISGQGDLVMDLLDPDYRTLAGPPSLESCTRDSYDPHIQWKYADALAWAKQGASVLQHLHDRGMMHGDFYSHNLLLNGAGHLILSDFGAASFLEEHSSLTALEIRAWGIWVLELLTRCTTDSKDHSSSELEDLANRCVHAPPQHRPTLEEILETLSSLGK